MRRKTTVRKAICGLLLSGGLLSVIPLPAAHAEPRWNFNELHLQAGNLNRTTFQGGGTRVNVILTAQHARGWSWGDTFFFIDVRSIVNAPSEVYGEFYAGLGINPITGRDLAIGPLIDFGPRFGINWEPIQNVRKILPGWRLSWDLPGFRWFNTDFYLYLDANAGASRGGAPKEADSWQVDVNFSRPFAYAGQQFAIQGHAEYTAARKNEFGVRAADWFLTQIQFRFDLGHAAGGDADNVFIGFEWQTFINKLGDPDTDEHAIQALIVWQF